MNAAARSRVGGATAAGGQQRPQPHNPTSIHDRRNVNGNGSGNAKFTAPLSSHSAGARRRGSGAAHGGAGGDGGTIDWKRQTHFGGSGGGRKLGSGVATNAGVAALTRTPRLEQPTIASTLRTASNRLAVKQQREKASAAVAAIMGKHDKLSGKAKAVKWELPVERRRPVSLPSAGAGGSTAVDRKEKSMTATAKQAARARLWPQRKAAGGAGTAVYTVLTRDNKSNLEMAKDEAECADDANLENEPVTAVARVAQLLETGIQTNEKEILNHDLVIGDIKLMMPSPSLVEEIEKSRKESRAQLEKQSMRKFASHEQHEEIHLTELKEFMERNCVTKRSAKKPVPSFTKYEQNHFPNVFNSMDEFFNREVPKAESITNIKERIKRKEQELMSLFDVVELNEKSDNEL